MAGPPIPSADLSALAGRRTLLVAATGGHLEQLVRFSRRLECSGDSRFVTFDSPQSRSLLVGRDVLFVPYVSPRDWRGVAGAARLIRRSGVEDFDAILSTGAAVALAALPVASRNRPYFYIDTISRFDAPSMTGRIMAKVPRVRTFTQHEHLIDSTWPYAGSVLDDYRGEPRPLPEGPLKIFVTLGTIRPYRFDAAIDALLRLLRPEDEVVWQLGETNRDELPGTPHAYLTDEEFKENARQADVVVTHAGVGSLLGLADLGIRPLVLSRRAHRGEHVDDHQIQAAREFASRDLCRSVDAEDLTRDDLLLAPGLVGRPGRLRLGKDDSDG